MKTNDTLRYIYCMFIVIYTFLNLNDDRNEIIHFDNIENNKKKVKVEYRERRKSWFRLGHLKVRGYEIMLKLSPSLLNC